MHPCMFESVSFLLTNLVHIITLAVNPHLSFCHLILDVITVLHCTLHHRMLILTMMNIIKMITMMMLMMMMMTKIVKALLFLRTYTRLCHLYSTF